MWRISKIIKGCISFWFSILNFWLVFLFVEVYDFRFFILNFICLIGLNFKVIFILFGNRLFWIMYWLKLQYMWFSTLSSIALNRYWLFGLFPFFVERLFRPRTLLSDLNFMLFHNPESWLFFFCFFMWEWPWSLTAIFGNRFTLIRRFYWWVPPQTWLFCFGFSIWHFLSESSLFRINRMSLRGNFSAVLNFINTIYRLLLSP